LQKSIASIHALHRKVGQLMDIIAVLTGLNNTQETYIPEIEEAIYKLKAGEISDPVFTQNY
jgi:hypothetical protein